MWRRRTSCGFTWFHCQAPFFVALTYLPIDLLWDFSCSDPQHPCIYIYIDDTLRVSCVIVSIDARTIASNKHMDLYNFPTTKKHMFSQHHFLKIIEVPESFQNCQNFLRCKNTYFSPQSAAGNNGQFTSILLTNNWSNPWKLTLDHGTLTWIPQAQLPYGCLLKWCYPTTMAFPTKNAHFGAFWGYHHLRKHPSCD